MTSYRRARIPGGTYFFTVALADRRSTLLVDRADPLRDAFRDVRRRHLHALGLDQGRVFAPDSRFRAPMLSRRKKGERGIWQRRFWEHVVRDERDLQAHLDYIHFNPVKHGHARSAGEWPYTSFHRYVNQGVYKADWAAAPEVMDLKLE